MKKSLLLLGAICTLLVSAQTSFARTYEDDLAYCENWTGKWSIVTKHGTDNVTFDTMCLKDQDCFIKPDIQLCQATGKRESDNYTIMISLFSFNYDFFGYYEFATWDNTTTINQNTPADVIYISSINLICDTFKGDIGIDTIDDFQLKSGKKIGSPDNCSECIDKDGDCYGDNCSLGPDCNDNDSTVHDNCTTCELQKIIPGKITTLSAILLPLKLFVIIGSGDPEFVAGDKAVFEGEEIQPLIQLKISKKLIIAICLVHPFKLTPGEIAVTVGDCAGSITVK